MVERARELPDRGWYFDIVRLIEGIVNDQTPATPAVSLLYALAHQLGRIEAEGIEGRWKRHLAMQEMTISWVDELNDRGVEVGVLAPEGHRSPTITCVTVPTHSGAPELVAALKARGWVIGSGYGKLKDSTVRIGHMGDHTPEELEGLLEVMSSTLLS
jgi:aspartate aminotransferase-like enzyme